MYQVSRKLLKPSFALSAAAKKLMSTSTQMKLALCQLSVTSDKAANIQNCVEHISKCQEADVIVRIVNVFEFLINGDCF